VFPGLRRLALHRDDTRSVLRIASPIVLGTLSFTLLNVVDTIFVGRLGTESLAAAGVAGVLFFAIAFPLSSISVGVQTLTSRRFGERRYDQCGQPVRVGLLLAALVGVPVILLAPQLSRGLAPILSNDTVVIDLGKTYLQFRFHGTVFLMMNAVFGAFFAALGDTKHQMAASFLVTVSNIVLDTVLIFGYCGFPALGVKGAAIASTIALALGTTYYVATALTPRYRIRYALLSSRYPIRRWAPSIVRLSLPIVVQRFVSHATWFGFFSAVARIGTTELAATNAMRSIYHLSIMLAVGFGTAAAALVGQNLGAADPARAERLAWGAVKLAAYSMGLIGLVFAAMPTVVMHLYTSDPSVIAAARLPLTLLGFVQALAGVALVLSNALQGAGNTRFVMGVEITVCGLLYIPIVLFFGLGWPIGCRFGLLGAWTAEYVYWTVLAALMVWKFRRGKWKQIVV